jgi:hypothetical protein
MKKVLRLTESDLIKLIQKVINEQSSNPLTIPGSYYGTYGYDNKGQTIWSQMDNHTKNTILSIGTAFIPVVGIWVSSGVQLLDAYQYYKEGDKKTAGLMTMFACLPVIGKITSLIPGVKTLGTNGLKNLALKIKSGNKQLTKTEQEVIEGISKNSDIVKQSLDDYVKNLSNNKIKVEKNPNVKNFLKKIALKGLGFAAAIGGYVGAAEVYDKTYDYYNQTNDLSKIDINKISKINIDAANKIKFD